MMINIRHGSWNANTHLLTISPYLYLRVRTWIRPDGSVHVDNPTYARNDRERVLKNSKKYRLWIRHEALLAYAEKGRQLECKCCQLSEEDFLSLDHIEGNGNRHRKEVMDNSKQAGTGFYYWLKRSGWPSGYQVLCYNCNFAKGFNGHCPHQAKQRKGAPSSGGKMSDSEVSKSE